MFLSSGTKLGPYEIQSPLGAGGMGEVYRARDTRLGRDVALKILPESFARDTERLRRFEQEAHSVAALNHPNILGVFDIGQHNGSPFLVSELLEGDTLRTVLDRGPLPQRKTIDYGVQIAQGLASAHEKGVVHRDVKPENIFIMKDGRIKLLDFGLAKLSQKASAAGADSDGVTLTSSHTAAGLVMGTAGYMAPEQVRGEPADPRTDIFAFGAVLYEMLSGRRAFRRDTPAETMTAILREDPPEFTASDHPVSPALDRIVGRCLEKNPEQRFQSAKDLSFALAALTGTDSSAGLRIGTTTRRLAFLPWALAAITLCLGAAVAWFLASRPEPAQRMQFAIPVTGEVSHMALSADGSTLVFISPEENSGLPMVYVQRIGSPSATLLPGTEGASYPFLSPDGSNVAFFANGKLQKMPVTGGVPQVLARVLAARGGSWGSRDVIIYAPDAGSTIWRVNADGTGTAPVTTFGGKEDNTHRWPVFLPDGDHFLFLDANFAWRDDRFSGIYLSSLSGRDKKLVLLCHSGFGYGANHLFYADDQRKLVSIAFNPASGTISGSTTVVANALGFQPSTFWAALTAANNGILVYNSTAGAAQSLLTWMDRSGKELGRVGGPAIQCNPTLSPDGSRVAVDISDPKENNVDVWLESTSGPGNTRFTFDPAEEVVGVWSRDSKTIAYRSNLSSGFGLMVKPATGLERERLVLQGPGTDDFLPNSWSPDDMKVLVTHQGLSGPHLELVSLSDGRSTNLLSGNAGQSNGMISPDGKWVAYASDESGSWEIYVTTFPGAAGKWQVSRGGGTEPRWRGDGKEIFYLGPNGMLTAVPVNSESGFSTGTPTPLFQFRGRAAISSTDVFSYDVTKDGKRFLVNRYVKPDHIAPLTIVLNAGANSGE